MIREIVAGYGATAARVRKAGVDGVEIVASHGYLPAQFLNPNVNRRDDEYGGTAQKRLRFLREVVAAVRSATGPDFVVGMRICGDEKDPEGLTEETSLEVIVPVSGVTRLASVTFTRAIPFPVFNILKRGASASMERRCQARCASR